MVGILIGIPIGSDDVDISVVVNISNTDVMRSRRGDNLQFPTLALALVQEEAHAFLRRILHFRKYHVGHAVIVDVGNLESVGVIDVILDEMLGPRAVSWACGGLKPRKTTRPIRG